MPFDVTLDARSALEWYTVSALRTILRHRGDSVEHHSKVDCLIALRECLFEPASIRFAVASCNHLTREALELLKRRGGVMPVAAVRGQLAVWHPELSPAEIGKVPSELVRRALAFWHAPSPRGAMSSMHDVPRPAADNPLSVMLFSAPEILDEVTLTENPPQHPLAPLGETALPVAAPTFQRRLLGFLRAVETRSPRMLQSGLIAARDRDALSQALGIDDDERGPDGGRKPSQPVSFFHSLLVQAGLIEISGDRILRTTAETLQFISLAPAQQSRTLLATWLEHGENELLTLPHLRCERRANVASVVPDAARVRRAHRFLLDLIRQQVRAGYRYGISDLSTAARYQDVEFLVSWQDPTPYRWSAYYVDHHQATAPSYVGITLDEARGRSRSLEMGEDWDLVEGEFIRAVLRGPLSWLGLVDLQVTAAGEQFALTDLGAQVLEVAGAPGNCSEVTQDYRESLVVQPNFDLVVYEPEQRHDLLYQIDRFAERVSVDRLAIYRITRDSLNSGLQLGMRVEDVLALLEGAARTPLPQNVSVTLRDWARRFDEVQLVRNAWLLEAPSAAALDRWLEDPALAGAVERRVSPTIALFTRVRPEGLLEKLADRLAVDVRPVDASAPLIPCARAESATTLRLREEDHDLYTRAALTRFADPIASGRPYDRYRMTPDSIRRGLSDDLTPDGIVEVLRTVIRGSLPNGMVLRIKGWAGEYPPVALGTVGILVAPDAECFRNLHEDPAFARAFLGSLTSTTAIVRLDALEQLRGVLAECGIQIGEYQPPAPRGAESGAFPTGPFVMGGALVTPVQDVPPRIVIEEAIARKRPVALRYQHGGRHCANHLVEPWEIKSTAEGEVLRGYCVATGHPRNFRLADILEIGGAMYQ